MAFNGIYNGENRWESSTNTVSGLGGNQPMWFMIDLGAEHEITDIAITWHSANAATPGFTVRLTNDTALWEHYAVTGGNAGGNTTVTSTQLAGWQQWRDDSRWDVAWDVEVSPTRPTTAAAATANLTTHAMLLRGLTALPSRSMGGTVTHEPFGTVNIANGGTGRFLMIFADHNGNSDGAMGHSIQEIEIYGTPTN